MLSLRAQPASPLREASLPHGGGSIGVNSRYFLRDGRPWIPVSGEFHYSRSPHERWREELLKMRAGGITAVASYVIWIHHEELPGRRSFDGDLDLRRFVTLCGEADLDFVARIGPWTHGEVRNGGLPDWVLREQVQPRTNDPGYLDLVTDWYASIAGQLQGLDHEVGGPIIAIQVENELKDNPEHLAELKRIARAQGLKAPLWTATGWGANLPDDELLPFFGAYTDGFWFPSDLGWPDSGRRGLFFSTIRDGQVSGADLRAPGPEAPDEDRYPVATCELGGGMAISYHRRPTVSALDTAAQALCRLGSGSNWQGYYMFHGGTNPVGQTTMQESRESGYPNDLEVINYDFQAPLGQYGQYRDAYDELRLQHLLLADFGDLLAPMTMTLPDVQPDDIYDRVVLRWAVRHADHGGFLFVNTHQPYEPQSSRPDVQFEIELSERAVLVPSAPVTIPAGIFGCWPINIELAGLPVAWATAQPICTVDNGGRRTIVFTAVAGIPVEIALPADRVTVGPPAGNSAEVNGNLVIVGLEAGPDCVLPVQTSDGLDIDVLVLDAVSARRLYKGHAWGATRILLSESGVVFDHGEVRLHGSPGGSRLLVYPPVAALDIAGTVVRAAAHGPFADFAIAPIEDDSQLPWPVELVRPSIGPSPSPSAPSVGGCGGFPPASPPAEAAWELATLYRIGVAGSAVTGAERALIEIDWTGDVARAYVGDRLLCDQFYSGRTWSIELAGLSEAEAAAGVTIRILAAAPGAAIHVSPPAQAAFTASAGSARVDRVTVTRSVVRTVAAGPTT